MLGLCRLIMFVIADEGFADIEVSKKLLSLPGVFAGDDLHFFAKDAEGSERDVFQIAYRGCDKV